MTTAKFASANWRKSNLSGDTGCVEVAFVDEAVGVRDSKLANDSPILVFSHHEWSAFLKGAGDGEFNLPAS
jgi:hypothetical protein